MAEYQRLDEVCHINMGQSPDSKSYNQEGVGLPFFQGNADFGAVHPETRVWCSSPTKIVEAGTLLISVRAPIGALNFAKERSCIGRGLAGITPQNGVRLKYIYYCLKGKNKELNAKGTGSTFKAIAKSALGETSVKIVSEEDQLKIIQTLDRVSSVIEARKQQLTELDNLIKARFIELFGDPDENPMKWETTELDQHLDIVGGFAFKSDGFADTGIPVLRIGNINSGHFLPVNMVFWPDDPTLARYKMYPGDLVMSLTGTVGKDDYGNMCILSDEYSEYYLNQRNAKLAIKATLNKHYLSEMLKFSKIKKRLTGISRGVRQANISNKDILALCVPIPPITLQEQFAAFVEQTDKSKVVVQKALDEAQTLFDSLMQEYFR